MKEYIITVLENDNITCKIRIDENQKKLIDTLIKKDLFWDECRIVITPLERDEIIDLTK